MDIALHPVSRLLFHPLGGMSVYIQSKAGGRMSQIGLHSLDIVPAFDGGNCVRVSEIMKTGIFKTQGPSDFLEVLVHGEVDQVSSDGIGEYQPGWIAPDICGIHPVCFLLFLPGTEKLHDVRRDRDDSGSASFGWSQHIRRHFLILALTVQVTVSAMTPIMR